MTGHEPIVVYDAHRGCRRGSGCAGSHDKAYQDYGHTDGSRD
ncbi:hypothetical protein [Sporomusa ovata]|nr:hypothetical protein [Sporomusa ovata]